MRPIEALLNEACPDQREALKAFAATGDVDALVRVHSESCDACDRILDEIISMRIEAVPDGGSAPVAAVRTRSPERVSCLLILVAASFIALSAFVIYFCLRAVLWTDSRPEVMTNMVEDVRFFEDRRTGLCYRVETYDGESALAFCEDVAGAVTPKFGWMADRIWHFQDTKTGACYAGVKHHGDISPVPVPCSKVSHLFDTISPGGRWRYEQRW